MLGERARSCNSLAPAAGQGACAHRDALCLTGIVCRHYIAFSGRYVRLQKGGQRQGSDTVWRATRVLLWFMGGWEIGVIAGLIGLLFFSRRIPEAMRSLGRGITQFRKGLRDKDTEGGDEQADKKEALPAPKESEGAADADTKKEKPADAAPGPSEPDSQKKDGPSESSSS